MELTFRCQPIESAEFRRRCPASDSSGSRARAAPILFSAQWLKCRLRKTLNGSPTYAPAALAAMKYR